MLVILFNLFAFDFNLVVAICRPATPIWLAFLAGGLGVAVNIWVLWMLFGDH